MLLDKGIKESSPARVLGEMWCLPGSSAILQDDTILHILAENLADDD